MSERPVLCFTLVEIIFLTFRTILLHRLIPESERWLISQGRYEDAENILQYRARFNKISKPPKRFLRDAEEYKQLKAGEDGDKGASDKNKNELNIQNGEDGLSKEKKGGYGKLYDEPKVSSIFDCRFRGVFFLNSSNFPNVYFKIILIFSMFLSKKIK